MKRVRGGDPGEADRAERGDGGRVESHFGKVPGVSTAPKRYPSVAVWFKLVESVRTPANASDGDWLSSGNPPFAATGESPLEPIGQTKFELDELIRLFFDRPDQLGRFVEVTADGVPPTPRRLLAHDHHMTVTVEGHHGGPVDVQVLETRGQDDHYARKILLTRQADGVVVQFGIVRLDLTVLGDDVRREIEAAEIPLGRVLINHNVWREVRLLGLFSIEAGAGLAEAFGVPEGESLYGRTAIIWCNGRPAIELLEVVGNLEPPGSAK